MFNLHQDIRVLVLFFNCLLISFYPYSKAKSPEEMSSTHKTHQKGVQIKQVLVVTKSRRQNQFHNQVEA